MNDLSTWLLLEAYVALVGQLWNDDCNTTPATERRKKNAFEIPSFPLADSPPGTHSTPWLFCVDNGDLINTFQPSFLLSRPSETDYQGSSAALRVCWNV